MPELIEQMYCSQQIVIPPKFPYILKRYCKAAIKTQPYDLLRWSFEYFKALAQNRAPPVKLRLEYPVFSTEGGLTRGCLKVLANLLLGMTEVPLPVLKSAWGGFCLDPMELKRIMCLCGVYKREEAVPFFHFIAVAGGLLTKSLTHTMILLCESLTKEPDGGSAAIPVQDFLTMYRFLARMDASADVRYIDGYKEGEAPVSDIVEEEGEMETEVCSEDSTLDDFWADTRNLQKLSIINDHIARDTGLSMKLANPTLGKIERSASAERAGMIERENYMNDRKEKPEPDEEINKKLKEMSDSIMETIEMQKEDVNDTTPVIKERLENKSGTVEINVYDEDGNQIPYEFFGEPIETEVVQEEVEQDTEQLDEIDPRAIIEEYVREAFLARKLRYEDLERTFDEINSIVDKFKSANYDLGMVAGRQMSTTSGEFIAQGIEKEIMEYIDEQIGVLPDPGLKKKKAKPEEVDMIKDILNTFLDENMDIIVPEIEEVEEEELPIPEITVVYAVPGIGPVVDDDLIKGVEDYAMELREVQSDLFMPRNIRHFMCPPLEKFEEHKYEGFLKPSPQPHAKEEVATGGVMTD